MIIQDFRPEWVVAAKPGPFSNFVTDSVFLSQYAEQAAFPTGAHDYCIFKRKSGEAGTEEQSLDKSGF